MELFNSSPFQEKVKNLITRHHVPGLAIAVMQHEQVASAGFGVASIDPRQPCTADTLFDIASSAKSITAAAVALLVNDNERFPEVQYDTPMCELLPGDFVMADAEYTKNVTVDDVLGHRTGMPGHNDSYFGLRAEKPDDARTVTRNLRNLPVAAPLRSKYMYCNMMYTAASYLVEVQSKEKFSEFLQSRIFQPLCMHASALNPQEALENGLSDQLASGYTWSKTRQMYISRPMQHCPEGQGAGSVISSANDMIKWVKALMNHEKPISKRVYEGLTRLRSFKDPSGRNVKSFTSPSFYAAGLEIYYYRGHTVVWHNGSIDGFESRFLFLPEVKFGLVTLGNSEGAGSVGAMLARDLIDASIGLPQENPGTAQVKSRPKRRPKQPRQEKAEEERDDTFGNTVEDAASPDLRCSSTDVLKELSDLTFQEPNEESSSSQDSPLQKYTGSYWHNGYRGMMLQLRQDQLVADARDRSFGFTLRFEKQGDVEFIAHLTDYYGQPDGTITTEFAYDGDKVIKMGLGLEPSMKELIWFQKLS